MTSRLTDRLRLLARRAYHGSPASVFAAFKRLAGQRSTAAPALPPFYPAEFADLYGRTGRQRSGSDARQAVTGDELVMIVDEPRALVLHQLCGAALRLDGDVAECGVYKGGTAFILAHILRAHAPQKRLHLFDSFSGLPETLAVDGPHQAGDFGDASVALLERRLAGLPYRVYPGFFRDTLSAVADRRFSFVHIDVDIFSSALECTSWFYSRLVPGGVMLYDDYGFASTAGVRQCVDEFYAGKPESPVVLPTKQCFIIKA